MGKILKFPLHCPSRLNSLDERETEQGLDIGLSDNLIGLSETAEAM